MYHTVSASRLVQLASWYPDDRNFAGAGRDHVNQKTKEVDNAGKPRKFSVPSPQRNHGRSATGTPADRRSKDRTLVARWPGGSLLCLTRYLLPRSARRPDLFQGPLILLPNPNKQVLPCGGQETKLRICKPQPCALLPAPLVCQTPGTQLRAGNAVHEPGQFNLDRSDPPTTIPHTQAQTELRYLCCAVLCCITRPPSGNVSSRRFGRGCCSSRWPSRSSGPPRPSTRR